MQNEIRTLSNDIEVRSLMSDDKVESEVITGYALKFDTWSQDLGGFIETIDNRALDEADLSQVVALINHDNNYVLGRTSSGTLRLEVDEIGLRYTITPPNTTFAKDLMESMKRGDISQSSFAFTLGNDSEADEWRHNKDTGLYERVIKRFKRISDVSVVTVPAYQDTHVTVAQRSLEQHKDELQQRITKQKLLMELDLI